MLSSNSRHFSTGGGLTRAAALH